MNYEVQTKHKGFSLAEAMMATVVLGIAAAGVLLPFTSGATVRAEGMRRTLAAKLASDLMEKIIREPFEQIVDNYNYSESEGQVKDASDAVFTDPAYARYSRDVSCDDCVEVYVSEGVYTTSAAFIKATVRVYYAGREVAIINRLISE